jgi:SPP1 gp7 family putative phage head morphogenesis protein
MAFKASKARQRRAPEPVSKGKPIGPSAAIRSWYESAMNSVVAAMLQDYRDQVREALEHPEVEEFYAEDAADSVFQRVMRRLNKKWSEVFTGFAQKYAAAFVERVDEYSKSSVFFSLSAAGVNQPTMTYNKNVAATLGASKDFNHTLITNVQKEVHEKIYSAVMLSLTSPNPEEQGASGIQNALREVGTFAKKRVDLITRDQTSKLYSALSDERLRQNGVDHFEWMHSSAGKVPRQTHLDKDGKVFALDDPELWTGPKADQGPPGWAINCRCRKRPIIGYRDDDEQ